MIRLLCKWCGTRWGLHADDEDVDWSAGLAETAKRWLRRPCPNCRRRTLERLS